jgi:hypothetical protein
MSLRRALMACEPSFPSSRLPLWCILLSESIQKPGEKATFCFLATIFLCRFCPRCLISTLVISVREQTGSSKARHFNYAWFILVAPRIRHPIQKRSNHPPPHLLIHVRGCSVQNLAFGKLRHWMYKMNTTRTSVQI